MTVFDAPINGRSWKQDCLRRDDLLLMLAKGNKLGYTSFLRQLVNEMLQFRSAAALEERRQRGQGICVSPGTRGWGEFDGWQDIEFPQSELSAFNKEKPQQNPAFATSCSLSANKRRSTRSSFRWLNCSGPIGTWTHTTTPIGLAPVKQTNQKIQKPIVPEHNKSPKQLAQWMAIVKGKAVPLPSAAAPKLVNYPIGYAPVKLPNSLRGGGARERAKRKLAQLGAGQALISFKFLLKHQPRLLKHLLEKEHHALAPLKAARPFAEQTVIDDRIVGVQYRRRPPAQSESERLQNPERFACAVSGKDNRFVVPHNRFLALKYRSHINVEWIQGDACIKYVLKYVMKGCQLAFVQIVNDTAATTAGNVVVNYDEFRQIRMARYQTPNEALLSIWGNKLVRKSHQVEHQRFHLPGQNRLVVVVGQEEERAEEERARIAAGQDQHSALTSYFALNAALEPDVARRYTFMSICHDYWYDRRANQWKKRVQRRKNHLAMLEAASAGNFEHQALRMLLLHVHGPTGWHALYAGQTTFVDAAKAMGLLEDSALWVDTILEALSGLPTFRRRINWTAVLFANSGILDASSVLDRVLLDARRLLTPRAMLQQDLDVVRQYVLCRMELVFRLHGVDPASFNSCCERLGLPAPLGFVMPNEDIIEAEYNAGDYGNRLWAQFLQEDSEQTDSATDGPMTTAHYAAKDAEFSPQLNDKQRAFIETVCASVQRRRDATLEPAQQLFMLTGDGGTGKTFAYNALIARLKSKMSCRLIATASTGIAAELLFEGATLHSKLRVPIDIDDDTMPMLDYESDPAKLLRALELLIIDEISIANKNVISYVDKLLRSIDVSYREKHFGGKIVVFGGDWKQLLPVAESSGAVGLDSVNMAYWMSVKTTPWFTNGLVNINRLTENMRVTGNQEDYRRTLKTWGTGVTVRTAASDDRRRPYVQLCPSLCLRSEEALIEFVFGDALKDPLANIVQLRGAAILCPLNKDTFKLNAELMKRISNAWAPPAQQSERVYISVDTVDPDSPMDVLALNVAERYIENIYGKTPSGMPEHILELKVGAVMMVIKNISVAHGLCNGTRVQIIALGDNIITCRYIQGPRSGTEFKMYRHRFRFGGRGREATRHGAVKWTRLQFPLRPGFVITTHKAQGQTLARVGVHLSSSQCFAHGQFYVAMSRVRTSDDIRVLTSARSANCVQNCVVQAVVDKEDIEEARQYAGPALIARLKSKMACRLLATASTGIAAQLLFEGATLHSKLRVPIDIDDDTMPMLDYESDPAKLLRALELLIIDEISIADKNVINYVDKLLRSIDVANQEKHFGGKIVVFGGDWKQLLPVAESSGALGLDSVNKSYWMSVKTTTWFTNGLINFHRLTVNMRQLEAEKRRQQLQQRHERITQLWEPQTPPNASTARPSPPQSSAPKGKGQGASPETVQEQSLDDFASATAGLSRAQLKRLPYNVAGQPLEVVENERHLPELQS
uniref:ATP-dependent DNA helicase n=1 Tax=Globodera pallida TaxID=36090 RepID=A0A183CJY4_GLOPA